MVVLGGGLVFMSEVPLYLAARRIPESTSERPLDHSSLGLRVIKKMEKLDSRRMPWSTSPPLASCIEGGSLLSMVLSRASTGGSNVSQSHQEARGGEASWCCLTLIRSHQNGETVSVQH